MHAHIVLAHPEPKSFNAHLAATSKRTLEAAGLQCSFTDLYALDFDPREAPWHYAERSNPALFHPQSEQRFSAETDSIPADVKAEIDRLLQCDLLIVHFPLWWFGMPAILKGWIDRVFVYGHLYRSTMRYDTGICAGKKMIACVTTGASEGACAFNGREGDTQLHLWPLLFPFRYIGFEVLEPEVFHGVGSVAFMEGNEKGLSTLESYTKHWAGSLETLSSRGKIDYNQDNHFDETKRLKPGAPVYSPFVRHEPQAI